MTTEGHVKHQPMRVLEDGLVNRRLVLTEHDATAATGTKALGMEQTTISHFNDGSQIFTSHCIHSAQALLSGASHHVDFTDAVGLGGLVTNRGGMPSHPS